MSEPTDIGGTGSDGGLPTPFATAASRVLVARIAEDPIGLEECVGAVEGPSAGAVVTFAGVVRDHDEGRGVTSLSYSAHPEAEAAIRESAERIAAAHPEVVLAVVHRTGDLGIGDLALACAVASAHRGVAFAACSALVDDVKATVPIWKKQRFADGSSEWVAALG